MEPEENRAPRRPPPPGNLWIVLACAAFFLLGVFLGGGLAVLYFASRHTPAPRDENPGRLASELADWLRREQGLGAEEAARAEKIIGERMERVNALKSEAEADIARQIHSMGDDVSEMLEPKKAEVFRERVDRSCHRWLGHGAKHH